LIVSLLVTVPEHENQGQFKPIFGKLLDSFGCRYVARVQGSLDGSGYKIRMKRTYIRIGHWVKEDSEYTNVWRFKSSGIWRRVYWYLPKFRRSLTFRRSAWQVHQFV